MLRAVAASIRARRGTGLQGWCVCCRQLDLNGRVTPGISLGSLTGLDYSYNATTHLLTLSRMAVLHLLLNLFPAVADFNHRIKFCQ